MIYKKQALQNGINLLTVPMPSLPSATLTVWVKTGSRNEEVRINGISHFLEHMVFKGSKKRPSARQISEAVDAIGGEFNAGTSKDWTNFYIKARSGSLPVAFDVLSDMVLNPILDKAEIEREKGVIIEEIAMYEDTPMIKIGDVFEDLIFEGSSLGRDIAGTPETVKAIKRDDFVGYRKERYYPNNIILTTAGGINEAEVKRLAEKYFGNIQSEARVGPWTGSDPKAGLKLNKGPRVKLHSKKKEQAHFILGFEGDGRGYEGRFSQAVLSAILGGGMSSRLFIEVRERRGLAYAVRNSIDRYQEVGYIGTYAGVAPEKIEEAIKVVLDEHYKISNIQKPISNKELTKAKEYLKGHLALALEDTREVNSYFGEQEMFLGKILTPEEVFRKVDQVDVESVYEEAKRLFKPEGLNLGIIGPYKNAERFREILSERKRNS